MTPSHCFKLSEGPSGNVPLHVSTVLSLSPANSTSRNVSQRNKAVGNKPEPWRKLRGEAGDTWRCLSQQNQDTGHRTGPPLLRPVPSKGLKRLQALWAQTGKSKGWGWPRYGLNFITSKERGSVGEEVGERVPAKSWPLYHHNLFTGKTLHLQHYSCCKDNLSTFWGRERGWEGVWKPGEWEWRFCKILAPVHWQRSSSGLTLWLCYHL